MTRRIRGWPWVALGLAVCVLQMQPRPEARSEPSSVKSQQIGKNSDTDKTAMAKDETSARQVALQAKAVLVRYCHSCHGRDGSAEGGFNYATDLQRLVERRKVIPGQPEASPLFRRVASGKMPPVDVEPRPTEREIAILKQWIAAGATLPEVPSSRAWVSETQIFQVILADLEKFPASHSPIPALFHAPHALQCWASRRRAADLSRGGKQIDQQPLLASGNYPARSH
jgi:mono/diheme cytochrome c family protein